MNPQPASLTWISLLLLAYCLAVLVIARRWDKPTYFDWTIAVYFAVIFLFLLIGPNTAGLFLSRYAVTGIYACLFTAAFFPPLLGLPPFTYHYAKKSTPRDLWENPIFIRINRIMTFVWSGIFTVLSALKPLSFCFHQGFDTVNLDPGIGDAL